MPRGAAVQLAPPPGAERGGWHLLEGVLLRRGGNYDARLYIDRGSGWSADEFFAIPASAKGVVHELVRLPTGVRRLLFDPGHAPQHDLSDLRLRRVGAWQRPLRMLRRVLPQLWLQPRAKRRQAGLTLARALRDLPGAYLAAGRLRAHAAAPAYRDWIASFDTLGDADRQRIAHQIRQWAEPPFFHVLLVGDGDDARQASQASLDAQLFRGFACTKAGRANTDVLAAFNAALAAAPAGHWFLMLRAGDVLAPHALYWLASAARRRPQALVIYADEDALDAADRRCHPQFKPDWSWAHARSTDFFGEAVAVQAAALARAGGVSEADCRHGCYDLVLRAMDAGGEQAVAQHIPAALLHRRSTDEYPAGRDAWAMGAVSAHLARRRIAASVEPAAHGTWRVRHALPVEPPLVSIIVPTRDALELTRRCLGSLRRETRYPRYEILLVDNQSTDPDALAWMQGQAVDSTLRLLHYDRPFNYAAINNMAVLQARGELVCLLNNDTEIMQADWLDEMVGQLLQPGVDVVGAKLLYGDGRVQHAGDLLGVGGVANHAHAWLEGDAPGYCRRAIVAQEYSAVTAACLLTRRQRYLALGGLDERHLAVGFNDVDYCLRVREAGGHVVWTPHAVLLHHESVSRGKDVTPAQRRRARREAAYMRRRWAGVLARDPFHNPNLSAERPDFSLSHAPVVPKPWQA